MPSWRQLYLSHVAQTSGLPMLLEVNRAEGVFIYDNSGKRYFDMNSGIAVSSLGHCHPNVVKALREQAGRYLHTMVYGEHIHHPQVQFARSLLRHLDDRYEALYYLMSGTEATELAMKLVKRYSGRYEIIACRNAYHGSTQGAETLRSDASYKQAYLPLLPGIKHIDFNDESGLELIDTNTAGVIMEAVQGEAGVIVPEEGYLHKVQERCRKVGALWVIDEIQTGFGRTGYLFAHQKYEVLPDVLLTGKAMGGGMPIAGVISSHEIMNCLTKNPALGHITTFGGHPMSCAAALASLQTLLNENLVDQVLEKEALIRRLLKHDIIKEIRSSGLMMAVEINSRKYLKHIVSKAFEMGLLVDWFLFNNRSFRLAPPLIITNEQIEEACHILLKAMDYARDRYDK